MLILKCSMKEAVFTNDRCIFTKDSLSQCSFFYGTFRNFIQRRFLSWGVINTCNALVMGLSAFKVPWIIINMDQANILRRKLKEIYRSRYINHFSATRNISDISVIITWFTNECAFGTPDTNINWFHILMELYRFNYQCATVRVAT